MAIFELQKIVPSGNLRIALHLLGSFLARVRSKSSNISLFSCATLMASAKGTPLHCAAEAEGGLNEDMWSYLSICCIQLGSDRFLTLRKFYRSSLPLNVTRSSLSCKDNCW